MRRALIVAGATCLIAASACGGKDGSADDAWFNFDCPSPADASVASQCTPTSKPRGTYDGGHVVIRLRFICRADEAGVPTCHPFNPVKSGGN